MKSWPMIRRAQNGLKNGRKSLGAARSRELGLEQLESRLVLTVTYQGGALLTNVEAQAVYLGSAWNTNSAITPEKAQFDQFLSYLVNSPYMDMLTNAGYNVGRGTASAGVTDALSLGSSITDSQIQSDIQALITSRQVQAPDANRLYVVYVAPGVVVSQGGQNSVNTFLGYHGAFAGRDANGNSASIRYAVLPYPGSPNPSPSSQGFSSAFNELTTVTSHELAEAVTDPDVNYRTLGWYDNQLNGEIGDLTSQTTFLNGYEVQDVVGQNDQVISPTVSSSLLAPQNVSVAAITSTTAKVSWTDVTGATGYRVYLVNGSTTTLVGTVGSTASSLQVGNLTPGATESFKVEAYNSTQVADSGVVSVVMPSQTGGLTAPQNVTATALTSTTAQLSWSPSTGASGYRIYEIVSGQSVLLGSVSSSTTSVKITNLTPGSTASFKVEAYNSTSVADSAVVSVTLPQSQTLTAPVVRGTALSATSAQLSWGAVTGAQGYRIYYWNGYQAVLLGTVGSATTSVKITGLVGGGSYQFLVEAYNGTSVADSNWVTVTTPYSRISHSPVTTAATHFHLRG